MYVFIYLCMCHATDRTILSNVTRIPHPGMGRMVWIVPLVVVSALTLLCLIMLLIVMVYWRWVQHTCPHQKRHLLLALHLIKDVTDISLRGIEKRLPSNPLRPHPFMGSQQHFEWSKTSSCMSGFSIQSALHSDPSNSDVSVFMRMCAWVCITPKQPGSKTCLHVVHQAHHPLGWG